MYVVHSLKNVSPRCFLWALKAYAWKKKTMLLFVCLFWPYETINTSIRSCSVWKSSSIIGFSCSRRSVAVWVPARRFFAKSKHTLVNWSPPRVILTSWKSSSAKYHKNSGLILKHYHMPLVTRKPVNRVSESSMLHSIYTQFKTNLNSTKINFLRL